MARRGIRTRLVDLDPQGHIAVSLGLDKKALGHGVEIWAELSERQVRGA
jgi:cellulose biosynthesis protein BcsQ